MKWLGLIVAAIGLTAAPARAVTNAVVLRTPPSADASFPFWCDWGYDWDERCYQDFSDRLSIGGDVDKVWRSALHFPLNTIPHRSVVLSASLLLSFDGVCLAPRKTQRPCPPRSYTIDIHPIFHARLVPRARGRHRPARLSGIRLGCRCAAEALVGRDRPGDRMGGVRHSEQRPAPQARRGPGGFLHQRAARPVQ